MQKKRIEFSYEEYSSIAELNLTDRELVEQALVATTQASAQFSKFHVGAAARLSDGQIYLGSNYENTSITSCAEQELLSYLHALYRNFTIASLAVTFNNANLGSRSDFPITPCGKCRQLLLEAEITSGKPIRVIMAGQSGKVLIATGVASMLPLAYSAEYINTQV